MAAEVGAVLLWENTVKFDPRLLPTVLIVIDLLAAVGYAIDGGASEWRRILYWTAAATLTFCVTW